MSVPSPEVTMEIQMKHIVRSFLVAGGLALAATAGCTPPPEPAQSAKGPVLPDPGPDQEYEVDFPDGPPTAWRYVSLSIGDDLSRDCGLIRAHFKYDSVEPLPQDKLALRDIAKCLNSPAMRDRHIDVVGHADSRGTDAYNLSLARRRAAAVKKTLVGSGVDASRIRISSRGESGAVGNEAGQYSYGYDRRVDVTIHATPHRPAGG
ncbi:MAG: OmpA family protein [Polyangiaceae bacterium]